MVRLGELAPGTILSGTELIMHIARQLGEAEADKHNAHWTKETLGAQDFTVTGEEADLVWCV